jgi:hypothetical protein
MRLAGCWAGCCSWPRPMRAGCLSCSPAGWLPAALTATLPHLPHHHHHPRPQVLSKQFELVALVAQECPAFGKREGLVGISGCVDKLSDIKLKGPANSALMAIAEAVGPQFVAGLVHKKAAGARRGCGCGGGWMGAVGWAQRAAAPQLRPRSSQRCAHPTLSHPTPSPHPSPPLTTTPPPAGHKNPKVFSEALNTLAQLVAEFGLAALNVKTLLDWAKEDLGSTNPGVRNAAVQLLGVMHRCGGWAGWRAGGAAAAGTSALPCSRDAPRGRALHTTHHTTRRAAPQRPARLPCLAPIPAGSWAARWPT